MWVKICGITRYADALRAQCYGADAIGFVLTASPRRIAVSELKNWIGRITDMEKVGVFNGEDPVAIYRLARELGLDTLQLHGGIDERHNFLARDFRLIEALESADVIPERRFERRILLDASRGRGIRSAVARVDQAFIMAGGLDPQNVRAAIGAARPAGVDVSSGVEVAPGIKDREKMLKFIQEAKA